MSLISNVHCPPPLSPHCMSTSYLWSSFRALLRTLMAPTHVSAAPIPCLNQNYQRDTGQIDHRLYAQWSCAPSSESVSPASLFPQRGPSFKPRVTRPSLLLPSPSPIIQTCLELLIIKNIITIFFLSCGCIFALCPSV